MDNFVRIMNETVDQRELPMPPIWTDSGGGNDVRQEDKGEGIYQSGPSRLFAQQIVSEITSAKEMIVVSSVLLADRVIEEALLTAAERGVRVYLLLAGEDRLEQEPAEGAEFGKKVVKQHRAMLSRLRGKVLVRSAPHFHTKVMLVDPRSGGPGFLLTANLTSEALERNQEAGVRLHPSETNELFKVLRWAFWEDAEHELISDPRLGEVKPLGKVQFPGERSLIHATTRRESNLEAEILRIIRSATERLLVANFGWDANQEVVNLICQRARDGVEVIIITRPRPKTMEPLLAMQEAGATVLGYDWLHAKAVWSDAGEAIVMSANFQKEGLQTGLEVGLSLKDERAGKIRDLLQSWADDAQWWLEVGLKAGKVLGKVKAWVNGTFEEAEIRESEEVPLPDLLAESADKLEEAPAPSFPKTKAAFPRTHLIRYQWKVIAPTLAPKSEELTRKVPDPTDKKGKKTLRESFTPPMYREPNGRKVVAIGGPEQMSAAKALMATEKAQAIVIMESVRE